MVVDRKFTEFLLVAGHASLISGSYAESNLTNRVVAPEINRQTVVRIASISLR